MVLSLIASAIISFLTTLFATPLLIGFLGHAGIVGIDLNKKRKPVLPSSGGIAVSMGVITGLLTYVGLQTFVYNQSSLNLVAVTATVLIAMFVGFFDDLNVKSKKVRTIEGYDIRIGFQRWVKPLLTLPAAIPLMAISAGDTTMAVPLIGTVDFGLFYPLLLVPVGIVGASNMVNMLGGYNGIEAGMGLIYMLSMGFYALTVINVISSVIFFIAAAALLAFLRYNWLPAKILPGDSLTYLLGSLVAAGVIVGNMEKVGLIVMTPFIVQGLLKFYSRLKMGQYASDLGNVSNDGTVSSRYGKNIFSLTHLVMRFGSFKERDIAIIMMLVQLCFGILPFFFPK